MQIDKEKSAKYFSFARDLACFGGEWRINRGIKKQKEDTHPLFNTRLFTEPVS